MLERSDIEQQSKFGPSNSFKKYSQSPLQDLVLSLGHRLSTIQNSLNLKIDRNQCMLILETKAGFSHIKKVAEQLNSKFQKQRKATEERLAQQQRENIQSIEKCKDKLKGKRKDFKKGDQQKNIYTLKPQQLYLQSNETIFSIIVDELTELKQAQQMLQKNLEQRQRVTINLNNQVCEKIQNLQKELSTSLRFIRQHKKPSLLQESAQSWSNYEQKQKCQKQSKIKQSRSNGFQKTEPSKIVKLDSHQLAHVTRSIEFLQKDLSNKINIKDILPIIKKNLHPITQMIDQVKNYTQQAIESTKKILVNQSEINQQLCTVSKMAWWQSFQERDGYAVWNKQTANLIPENYVCQKNSNEIIIAQQGTYVFKILTVMDGVPEFIVVGGQEVQILGQSLVKIEKNTAIMVPSIGGQMFLSIHKI